MFNVLTSRKLFLLIGDLFLLYFSFFITLLMGYLKQFNIEILRTHLLPFSIVYLFWILILYIFGLYDIHLIKTKLSFSNRLLGASFCCLIVGLLFFYIFPVFGISPKTNLLFNTLIFSIVFWGWRNLFSVLFSNHFMDRIAILGEGEEIEKLKNTILSIPYLGYKFIPIDIEGDLFEQIKKNKINTIIFSKEYEFDSRLLKLLYFYSAEEISFLTITDAYELIYEKIPVSIISQAWFLNNIKGREKNFYDNIKRFLDILLSILLLIITLPISILISILIKTEDKGPIIYFQTRIGKDKEPFTLYKFRSMQVEAEKERAVWAKEKDNRITKIGKIIRRLHLDELPQMINIIKGDIAFIGPRPERPVFVEKLEKDIPYYSLRHIIKPGFTGWAQIKFRYGRSIMDSKEKFEYDLYYLKNRNPLIDIEVLLKTFQLLFQKS